MNAVAALFFCFVFSAAVGRATSRCDWGLPWE